MNVTKEYIKYVSRNILAMLGISCYILADTFFISLAAGTDGMAALNLVLPVYNLIFATGAMLGTGSATLFSIEASRGMPDKKHLANALTAALVIGGLFMLAGGIFPEKIMSIMGGTPETIAVGKEYTRTFMLFTPFFMINHIANAFVRNDSDPSLAMKATLTGSFSNIALDYLFMFPMKMGMQGAALATGISPIISILICSAHFFRNKSSVRPALCVPCPKRLASSCRLGVSAFMGELSSGIITAAFNLIILKIAGNIGIAAYGVISNLALVAAAVFNGIAQGIQPLVSRYHGLGEKASCRKVFLLAVMSSEVTSVMLMAGAIVFAKQLTAVFNSGNSPEMAAYAEEGMKIYFTGFIFAGFNIIASGAMSASEKAAPSAVISILRGFAAIIGFAFLLSALLGLTGVWLAFPAAELLTAILSVILLLRCSELFIIKNKSP